MRATFRWLGWLPAAVLLAGCSFAGDVTPPPGYQTAAAEITAVATTAATVTPAPAKDDARQPQIGQVSGTLLNITSRQPGAEQSEVSLHIYDDYQESDTLTTTEAGEYPKSDYSRERQAVKRELAALLTHYQLDV
jgi:hypothetical protein